ncbi:hypothetical protein [Streptomyces sp. NPDC058142]|uniref:hypothetical protein n=1 Tax=Streptomyces sp. NPDC058142 TaxID=3346355 RepID=UPI0036E0729E
MTESIRVTISVHTLRVQHRAEVPRASPDMGEDGQPTYRIPLEKFRRGAGRYFETRNVTDDGAASAGRLITEALAATRFARAVVEDMAPGTNRLLVWRASGSSPRHRITDSNRHQPVGPFRFGVHSNSGSEWAKAHGFTGSPFLRGRRTVNALDRREPAQNTQDTHDRQYVLVDKRVQAESAEIIAAGAQDAADRARSTVLVAELHDQPQSGDIETATAACRDYNDGPTPKPEGGCGASILKCLECQNARIHPGHHPRLAHLHSALVNLRSIVPTAAWAADWGDAHACLEDLRSKLGEPAWNRALGQVTGEDRDLITLLLTGDLDT